MPLPNFDSIKSIAVGKDNTNKQQALHILKAITDQEVPPKQKHIRAIILATFSGRSSSFFYDTTLRLAIYTNPVVCWKFLYIIHKLFRDGHRECVNDGLRHATRVAQLQSAWSNHATKCGYPIVDFCQLITRKLRLHRKYGILPGCLELNASELKNCLSAQADHLFQFSVDLMDMLEEILRFKDVVILSVDGIQTASFSPPGQCKLIPLIQCIQDAAALYELIIQVIFKLHELLGNGTMSGHRDRFKDLHVSIKKFFESVFHMHYFRSFVHIPSISQNPPNFCIQSELGEHTTLRVTMNETSLSPVLATTTTVTTAPAATAIDENRSQPSGDEEDFFELAIIPRILSPSYSSKSPIDEKTEISSKETKQDVHVNDNHNSHDNSNNSSKMNWNPFFDNLNQTNNHALIPHHANITDEKHEVLIEVELLKSEIERLKAEHHEQSYSLLNRIRILEDEIKELVQYKSNHEEQQMNYETKLNEKICQAQVFEEKFVKLKEVYTKLREEHVVLLRNHGNTQQTLQQETQKNKDLEKIIEDLCNQQIPVSVKNIESLSLSHQQVVNPINQSSELEHQINSYESQLDTINVEKDRLTTELSLMKQKFCLNEKKLVESQQLLEDCQVQISQLTSELKLLKEQVEQQASNPIIEIDVCNRNTPRINNFNDDKTASYEDKPMHFSTFKQLLLRNTIEQTLTLLESNRTATGQSNELMDIFIHCSPNYFLNEMNETINHFIELESALTENWFDSKGVYQIPFHINQFTSKLSILSIYSKSMSQSDNDNDYSRDYLKNFDLIQNEFVKLLNILQANISTNLDHRDINDNDGGTSNAYHEIREYLSTIHHHLITVFEEANKSSSNCLPSDHNADLRSSSDLIQKEMESTFETISLAEYKFRDLIAESKKHSANNEHLQVNSLILDCCSELLLCVGELVKQSEMIQQDIKDSSTLLEFYKPHNRWTNGFLSAAKFVGAGANVMVEIADAIVCGKDVKLERLIVISQEIAASTTQLVYATRVKTNPESEMFNKLQLISKEVCKCTGNLIACVKKVIEAKHMEELDFSCLTLTQAKRMEVELQVKIIELETSLTNERKRLAQLRRDNYQLSAEVEVSFTV
ncbi:unnamed protein product [Heterobilharzia americana]|nr:unnamed protein product [Heterobilharzia americana]